MMILNLGIYSEPANKADQAVSVTVTKGFLHDRLAYTDPGDIIEQFVEFLDQTGLELSPTVRQVLVDCAVAAGSSQAGKDVHERLQLYVDSM